MTIVNENYYDLTSGACGIAATYTSSINLVLTDRLQLRYNAGPKSDGSVIMDV